MMCLKYMYMQTIIETFCSLFLFTKYLLKRGKRCTLYRTRILLQNMHRMRLHSLCSLVNIASCTHVGLHINQ